MIENEDSYIEEMLISAQAKGRSPHIKGGDTLIFKMELLSINGGLV